MIHKIIIDGDMLETDDNELIKEFIKRKKMETKPNPYHPPIIIPETEIQRKIWERALFL